MTSEFYKSRASCAGLIILPMSKSKHEIIVDHGDFVIRKLVRDDAHSLSANANDREIWLNLRDRFPSPYTLRDAQEWISLVESSKPVVNFAISVDGEVAGGIGLMMQIDVARKTAEIGYWLGRKYWGRNIMSRAVGSMTDWYFANLDIVRIYAMVFEHNQASAKVLEKCGYTFEARLKKGAFKEGKVLDELLYARVTPD